MEALQHSATTNTIYVTIAFPLRPHKLQPQISPSFSKSINFARISRANNATSLSQLYNSSNQPSNFLHVSVSYVSSLFNSPLTWSIPSSSTASPSTVSETPQHWIVAMERPPGGLHSKTEIVNYYVETLQKVLGSEKDAQSCIYDVSCDTHFGFCCSIDEDTSRDLACLSGVISVRPDPDINSEKKDYGCSNIQVDRSTRSSNGSISNLLFPEGKSKHWIVRMDKPSVEVISKSLMVDFYVRVLTKVLGNEKDAQMCMYHISWQSNFGFCCVLDEECAEELRGIPGVLAVQPDKDFGSESKDYGGNSVSASANSPGSPDSTDMTMVHPKKLFVTGLSFYTSEKTLRASFEPFGELREVKIIMDKISKRSKGYAFIEYASAEAANAALEEMNGKIINGWMIVVDKAKIKKRYGGSSSRPSASKQSFGIADLTSE